MTRPKRFRGMELTEEEAAAMAQEHWRPDFATAEDGAWSAYVDRCMRLLPLWRKWGMNELYNQGRRDGYLEHQDLHRLLKRCEELDQ